MLETTCCIPECDRPARTRGMCSRHYQRQQRGVPIEPLAPTSCRNCGVALGLPPYGQVPPSYCSKRCLEAASYGRRKAAGLIKPEPRKLPTMQTCKQCSVEFPTARGAQFCSGHCSQVARDESGPKCGRDGCDRSIRAKGLCAGHWQKTYGKDLHREVPCSACGKAVVKLSPGIKRRPVCSDRCKYFITNRHWPASKELVGPVPLRPVQPKPVVVKTRAARYVFTTCAWCSTAFIYDKYRTVGPWLYCSRKCSAKAARVRRRGREYSALGSYTWTEVVTIYLQLGGCAYCGERTADLQPDHVIPLSRGGSNSITNVVPSCGPCNADKRDLYLHEWYPDRDRRGLPPRMLDRRVNHLTDAYLLALTG